MASDTFEIGPDSTMEWPGAIALSVAMSLGNQEARNQSSRPAHLFVKI